MTMPEGYIRLYEEKPPFGNVYGLIRKKTNEFRDADRGSVREEKTRGF